MVTTKQLHKVSQCHQAAQSSMAFYVACMTLGIQCSSQKPPFYTIIMDDVKCMGSTLAWPKKQKNCASFPCPLLNCHKRSHDTKIAYAMSSVILWCVGNTLLLTKAVNPNDFMGQGAPVQMIKQTHTLWFRYNTAPSREIDPGRLVYCDKLSLIVGNFQIK